MKKYISFEKSELVSKLDEEIDSINKNFRTMGIIEAIQEEIKRQTKEETALEVTQQIQNDNVKRLYERGFHVEAISEMLGVSLKFVKNAIQ